MSYMKPSGRRNAQQSLILNINRYKWSIHRSGSHRLPLQKSKFDSSGDLAGLQVEPSEPMVLHIHTMVHLYRSEKIFHLKCSTTPKKSVQAYRHAKNQILHLMWVGIGRSCLNNTSCRNVSYDSTSGRFGGRQLKTTF